MTFKVEKVDVWATTIEDQPGGLAGKLAVLAGVRDFPTRVKCAGLAWHTLKAAVSGQPAGPVSTE